MKPETRYTAAVHRALKPIQGDLYFEKTNNPYRGGIPDFYYEERNAFWVEYKWLPSLPRVQFTPSLSELQKRWLLRNFGNGHQPAVIVGTPKGGLILDYPDEWTGQVYIVNYRLRTPKEVAEWLKAKSTK